LSCKKNVLFQYEKLLRLYIAMSEVQLTAESWGFSRLYSRSRLCYSVASVRLSSVCDVMYCS